MPQGDPTWDESFMRPALSSAMPLPEIKTKLFINNEVSDTPNTI